MGLMNAGWIKCGLCGLEYDPAQNRMCASCPLQSGCEMACCPACGYQAVNVQRSVLARLAGSLFSPSTQGATRPAKRVELTLVDIPAGGQARVAGFLEGLPLERRSQLQAYGLTPNEMVHVLQHSPVTVIQIDQTELALEGGLASQIKVERIGTEERNEDRARRHRAGRQHPAGAPASAGRRLRGRGHRQA
jgi:Fe2+ transport system protein FeoA